MDKQDNSLVNKFLKQISKIIDHKLEKLTTVESAIVDQVNIDGSVNLHIPPDNTIFTGIQNQSIYQNLKVGDCVKVLKQNNKASNMWIIGGHNLKRNDTIEKINKVASNITDFIVEQDVSGIWTYRKWNNGTAECWGRYTASGINAAGHNISGYWYSDIIEILLPFDFLSIGYYQVDGGSEDKVNFARDYGDYSSGKKVGFRICGHESEATSVNISVYVSVKGRWK